MTLAGTGGITRPPAPQPRLWHHHRFQLRSGHRQRRHQRFDQHGIRAGPHWHLFQHPGPEHRSDLPRDQQQSAWLGNQTPAVTAPLLGPIDFPNIQGENGQTGAGFTDIDGNTYYNLDPTPNPNGNENNNNVEARWYGDITIPTPGGYSGGTVPVNFATSSDDGSDSVYRWHPGGKQQLLPGSYPAHRPRLSDPGRTYHRRRILPGRRRCRHGRPVGPHRWHQLRRYPLSPLSPYRSTT